MWEVRERGINDNLSRVTPSIRTLRDDGNVLYLYNMVATSHMYVTIEHLK